MTAAWIVWHRLRYDDITPDDVLAMWHEVAADDGRIIAHLRNALPLGGPVPTVTGIRHQVVDSGYGRPVALDVEIDGVATRLDETALVAICRQLLDADDPPMPPAGRKLRFDPLPLPESPPPATPAPAVPPIKSASPRPPKGDHRQFSLL